MVRKIHITLRPDLANGKVALNEIVFTLKGFGKVLIQGKSAVAKKKGVWIKRCCSNRISVRLLKIYAG